jgi:hypothetical protein
VDYYVRYVEVARLEGLPLGRGLEYNLEVVSGFFGLGTWITTQRRLYVWALGPRSGGTMGYNLKEVVCLAPRSGAMPDYNLEVICLDAPLDNDLMHAVEGREPLAGLAKRGVRGPQAIPLWRKSVGLRSRWAAAP